MIRRLFLVLVLSAAALVAPRDQARAGVQDFSVVNSGGAAIWYIFVSPNYSDSWETDVLGSDVLMPGSTLAITINGYGDHCFFDIRIEDENGYAEEYYDVNLCQVSTVAFPGSAPASTQKGGGGQMVKVVNNGSVAIWYIFVSPNYSDSWDQDVLGSDVLMPGYELPITLSGYGSHCFFDVRVGDANGYYLEYYDVDACNGGWVSFP